MKKIGIASALALGALLALPAQAQTYTRTDTISYEDNLSLWVLGQVKSSTNVNTGLVESRTDYDPATALPIRTYAFGKLQQTLTYDTTSAVSTGQRGTLKTVSDGRDSGTYNTTITFSNWKRGIPQTISYPDSSTKSAVVNDNGWLTSVTDENGYSTGYGYDAMGRLASIAYPTGDSVAWNTTTQSFAPVATAEYGIPAGHWKQTVSTGNGRQITYYDALWRPLVSVRYDAGNVAATRSVSVTRYDADGHPVYQSYPLASLSSYATVTQGTRTTYDALDRVTRVEQDSELGVLATTTQYLTGFQTRVTNPRGYATTMNYMAWDQPTTDHPVAITYPSIGLYVDIARDAFGKPTSVKRRNATSSLALTRSYAYNGYQELCRTVEPETGATLMGYDAAGNLAWSASGLPSTTACDLEGDTATILARKAIRTYDQRNRVSSLSFPDNRGNTTYDYAPDGLLDSIAAIDGSNTVTTNYTYNKRRLPTNEQMLWNSINWNIGYGYNSNGHLASQSYPGSLTVTYLPNALGQPTQAGAYATGVSYFPNGAIKQFTYGNGIVHTLTQNTRQLPDTSRDAYGATEYLDDGYDYDQNVNVAAISDGLAGARGNRTMTYDSLDRLKTVASPMYGVTGASYTYDLLDNLTRVTVGGTAARDHYYCYDANWRLTNVKTTSCSGTSVIGLGYDVQGNLANKNGVLYTFDYGNRLRYVDEPVNPDSSYVYDGHGRRVRDYTAGSKYSLYSQSGQLAFVSDGRTAKYTNYIYLGGSLVATREWPHGGGVFTYKYQHTDALGSPVAVTDASRVVVERSEYEPFGKVLNRAVHDGPGYTGHVEDAATGLTYMQQRYYDPGIGRFLSVDPVTANGNTGANFNRYWYANNNPYRFKDPDGRKCATADGKESCTFDEFKDKKGNVVTRDAALGGKVSQLFGRGSRILRAEKAMTAKYSGANALAAKNGSVTIKGSSSLGIADKTISGAAIARSMESTVTIANEGPAPNDTATLRHEGGVPSTLDGSPSPGPMQFWSDGANVKAGTLFAHEILHTIYSGVGETNRGWANPDYNLQHQVPFDDAANDL